MWAKRVGRPKPDWTTSKVSSDFPSPRIGVIHSRAKLWSTPPPTLPIIASTQSSVPLPRTHLITTCWRKAPGTRQRGPLSITPGGQHLVISTSYTLGWDLGRPGLTKRWHQKSTDRGLARLACLWVGPETLTRGRLLEPGHRQAGVRGGGGTPQGHPQNELPHLSRQESPGLAIAFLLGRGCLAAPKTPLRDSNEPSPRFNYPLSK